MGMLDGRVAIVSGGGRGVGAEIAKHMAAAGAKVLVVDPGVGGGGEGGDTAPAQEIANQIKAAGGIIAAPYHDPAAGQFPWFLVMGSRTDDLLVADEVLACAIEKLGMDTSRIYTLGMSAGGLHTAQMSFRRSNYIAGAVTYSGGISYGNPPNKDPSNKFAAMIFHGGPSDVVGISFQQASNTYKTKLVNGGHFAFICNHGNGHNIPYAATGSVWQFFQDHPWGTDPSPYESGLPSGFPSYCELN